jgi:hypothetical protein
MDRRSFLGRLIAGTAAIAVAPTLLSEPFMTPAPIAATIGEYFEYANFSSFAIASSIDELVSNSAVELGYRAGQSINELYKATYDV